MWSYFSLLFFFFYRYIRIHILVSINEERKKKERKKETSISNPNFLRFRKKLFLATRERMDGVFSTDASFKRFRLIALVLHSVLLSFRDLVSQREGIWGGEKGKKQKEIHVQPRFYAREGAEKYCTCDLARRR